MNAQIEALHTFARRYCIDQALLRHERYAGSGISPNSTAAQDIYPRYHALEAILAAVERGLPSDFTTVEETLASLIAAGQTAESFFTEMPLHLSGVAKSAMDAERRQFGEALQAFADRRDWSFVPLPSRRTLGEPEAQALWARLADRWDVRDADWYPLREVRVSESILAFRADALEAAGLLTAVGRLPAEHGIEKLWELRELRSEREMEIDVALFAPFYNGSEGYWTSGAMDWLVYASHEASLTFAGDWLVTAVKAAWPDWANYLWTVAMEP